ncbi:MAG: lamin tail domain-containing protein, partial [Candidatus Neomarinimicrobiota bacterium]|nr:lamin tail domain-containing protein [Candidatus Neomarinimicrobiota bacterium]
MKKTLTFCFINLLTVSLSFSQVVINEIMYNPYYETTPGDPNTYSTDDDGEFIELFNAGQSDVDISGWKILDAIDYTFPASTTIGAGKYLVLARSKARFKADHGTDADLEWGPGTGNGALANGGETVKLEDA